MSEMVFLLLGSNLGDRCAMLDEATRRLAGTAGLTLVAASSTYSSPPIDCPSGSPDFLNRMLKLSCALAPEALLDATEGIETVLGRKGKGGNVPRIIDIDIILYGDRVVRTDRLVIPHPRMNRRPFVLIPLREVAPEAVDPTTGHRYADLLPDLDSQGVVKYKESAGVQ
ncbi:MAG: 2-amino-4-hydroxy-6-hydroxymethyldihydropteridine diphosphokinase [candidate division Zixibacteria bacterium]|nr:2-amino-4-hydroxy-6-hydroxymethyldihydropteridine diphosphokinase [candidate division Zixibacteria bacterium]